MKICRARGAKEGQVAPTSSPHIACVLEEFRGAGFGHKMPPKHHPVTPAFLPIGVYILAGKPASPNPSQKGELLLTDAANPHWRPQPDPDLGNWDSSPISPILLSTGHSDPRGSRGQSRRVTSVTILYILVALSFAAWVLLFALAMVKRKCPQKGPHWAGKQLVWLKHPQKSIFTVKNNTWLVPVMLLSVCPRGNWLKPVLSQFGFNSTLVCEF